MACTAKGSVKEFRTKVGRPGRPNEPVATFKNSSIVELKWDKDFQVCPSILGKIFTMNHPAGGREGGPLGRQGVQGGPAVGRQPKKRHQRGGWNWFPLKKCQAWRFNAMVLQADFCVLINNFRCENMNFDVGFPLHPPGGGIGLQPDHRPEEGPGGPGLEPGL